MSRARDVVIPVLIVLAAGGCASHCTVGLPTVPTTSDQILGGTEPVPCLGYTDRQGTYHRVAGRVVALPPDSLEFSTKAKSGTFGHQREGTVRLSIADVVSIKFPSDKTLAGKSASSE